MSGYPEWRLKARRLALRGRFDAPCRRGGLVAGRDRAALFGGAAALVVGLALIVLVLANPESMADGVPLWIGVAAGGVFALAGVLVIRGAKSGGSRHDFATEVLVAVFVSVFAAVSMIFPPGGIFVAWLAVTCWIGVYRRIHERVTGRDPLAGSSDGKQLGLGCLVTILLILGVVLAAWLTGDRPPPEPLLPERMPGESR
jgi:low affinity Fe/Cu permease